MSKTIRYYLYMGELVRVHIDEDGDPETADVYNAETGEYTPDPVLAIDSQMGSSGFVEIDEATFNKKLEEQRAEKATS